MLSTDCVDDMRYDRQDDDKDQKRNHYFTCSTLFMRGGRKGKSREVEAICWLGYWDNFEVDLSRLSLGRGNALIWPSAMGRAACPVPSDKS